MRGKGWMGFLLCGWMALLPFASLCAIPLGVARVAGGGGCFCLREGGPLLIILPLFFLSKINIVSYTLISLPGSLP